jgi:hypothetical protein
MIAEETMSDSARSRRPADPLREIEHQLAQVVWQWLRSARQMQGAILEAELDRAVRDTFPASDPIAQTGVGERQDGLDEIDCVIADGCLTLRLHASSLAAAEEAGNDPPPAYSFDGLSPDGDRIKVYVYTGSMATPEMPAPGRSSETDTVDRPGTTDDRAARSTAS